MPCLLPRSSAPSYPARRRKLQLATPGKSRAAGLSPRAGRTAPDIGPQHSHPGCRRDEGRRRTVGSGCASGALPGSWPSRPRSGSTCTSSRGFLQAEDYAWEIISRTGPALKAQDIERRVAARFAWQEALLDRSAPPQIHVVFDESAIRRQVGGADVMRRQLAALIEAARRPHVTLQVLPFAAGGHAGAEASSSSWCFRTPRIPLSRMSKDSWATSTWSPTMRSTGSAWLGITYWGAALGPNESVAMLDRLSKQSPVEENLNDRVKPQRS